MSVLRKVGKGVLWGVAGLVGVIGIYVGYASATASGRLSFPNTPYPPVTASKDPAAIERGRYLVHGPGHCGQCHSTDQRDRPELVKPETPLSGGLEFAMGPIGTRYAPNLTSDPETGIGKLSDAELARAIRTGVLHDGQVSFFMRFAAGHLSDEDLAAVMGYLRTLPPVRKEVPPGEWKIVGKAMLPLMTLAPRPQEGPRGVPPGSEPSVARGEYLAEHVALCVACHSAVDDSTFENVGPKAAGGSVDPSHGSDTDMEFAPPNLTADPETGYTGRVTEDAFVTRMRGGRAIASSIMPWESFAHMTDADLRSVYRYLKSLPPVKNDPGPSYRQKGWRPGDA